MKNFKKLLPLLAFVLILIIMVWMSQGMPGIKYIKP